jgi:hypothetical protein
MNIPRGEVHPVVVAVLVGLTVVGILLATVLQWHRIPPGHDAVVDSAVTSAPRERARTDTVLQDTHRTLVLVARLRDSVTRVLARAAARGAERDRLRRELSAARTPQDTIANLSHQVTACEGQVSELSTAAQTCQAAASLAVTHAVAPLEARLRQVQARADSIPTYVQRAVDAAPCTRNWGLVHPPCLVVDALVLAGGFTAGAVVSR